jgi:predicted nucleic acid-binding protein
MTDYPDTSFLCSIYREQEHSSAADAHWDAMSEPLHVAALLEFEFLQSIRLQVWLHKQDRTKGFGESEAAKMIADWDSDLATGAVKIVSCDMPEILRYAGTLSVTHTSENGHRSLDVLHVATAVHLGARRFLSFDDRQKKLARAAGLKTPL